MHNLNCVLVDLLDFGALWLWRLRNRFIQHPKLLLCLELWHILGPCFGGNFSFVRNYLAFLCLEFWQILRPCFGGNLRFVWSYLALCLELWEILWPCFGGNFRFVWNYLALCLELWEILWPCFGGNLRFVWNSISSCAWSSWKSSGPASETTCVSSFSLAGWQACLVIFVRDFHQSTLQTKSLLGTAAMKRGYLTAGMMYKACRES